MSFLGYACKRSAQEPSLDLLFKQEALQHENASEWQEAEDAYRHALELAEAQDIPGLVYKAQADLSDLFSLLGQNERALEAAQAVRSCASFPLADVTGMALLRFR